MGELKMTKTICFAPHCPCSRFTAWQWWDGLQGVAGSRAHRRCCGDVRSWTPMAELLATECGSLELFCCFLKIKTSSVFFPPWIWRNPNCFSICAFRWKCLSSSFSFCQKIYWIFFLNNIQRLFFPPQAYSLCWTDALFFTCRLELPKWESDRQANFLKFSLVLLMYQD